jgi:hypothetical protein
VFVAHFCGQLLLLVAEFARHLQVKPEWTAGISKELLQDSSQCND